MVLDRGHERCVRPLRRSDRLRAGVPAVLEQHRLPALQPAALPCRRGRMHAQDRGEFRNLSNHPIGGSTPPEKFYPLPPNQAVLTPLPLACNVSHITM